MLCRWRLFKRAGIAGNFMNATSSFRWIETLAWQLDFFGLPHRVPWNAEAPEPANNEDFELDALLTGCEALLESESNTEGPWKGFVAAGTYFDDMTEALEDQEYARAATLLAEIEKHHPCPYSIFHRAFIARQTGRDEEATQLYVEVVNKAPNLPFAWNNLGTMLAENGNRDQAIQAFVKAAQLNAQDTVALEALVHLKAAVKMLKDPKDPQSAVYLPVDKFREAAMSNMEQLAEKPDQLIQFGQAMLRDGVVPDVGLKALEKARELMPDDSRVSNALAMAYHATKQLEKSKEMLLLYTEQRAEDPWGFFNLSQVLKSLDDKAGEKAALEKTLEIEPNIQPALAAYFGLAEAAENLTKSDELAEFARKRDAWMPLLLASGLARDRNDIPNAVKYAEEAYERNPKAEEVLLHYCAMLGDAKDGETLDLIVQPAITGGNYSKRLDWNYAQCLRQAGQNERAVEVLQRALCMAPPEDFKAAAEATLDFWAGLRVQSEAKFEIHPNGTLLRPILLTLPDGDGGVLIQPREKLPAMHQFKARITPGTNEVRVQLQQGQSGFDKAPLSLGAFLANNVQPVDGDATTVECSVEALPNGHLIFSAVQNGSKLPVITRV